MHFIRNAIIAIGALLPFASALPAASPLDAVPKIIPGKYIVTLKESANLGAHTSWLKGFISKRDLAARSTIEKTFTINSFRGYSGAFDATTIAELKRSVDVISIEPDQIWTLQAVVTQSPAIANLASISSRQPNAGQYVYDDSAGEGTYAYVIDTGINTAHVEFEGRAFWGYNAVPGSTDSDNNGHGTHCAGTIASKTYGVAKKANVIAVKVFDSSSGTTSNIIDGIQWAVKDITAKGRAANSVLSMSLGGPYQQSIIDAVEAAFKANILPVVAAGNSNAAASFFAPAAAPNALTVGAIDATNRRASFSNYGRSVDVFTIGVNVLSTWIGSNTATNTISGTSMACPAAAGLALYLKRQEGITSAGAVSARIVALSTKNLITNAGLFTPNRIAYNGIA